MSRCAPRVLILTASYGSGHNRVAAALASSFRAEGAVPRVVDHFESFVSPEFNRITQALYLAVLRRAPVLWGAAYWLSDHLPVWSPLLLGMNRIGMRRLARSIAADRPDLILSAHRKRNDLENRGDALSWTRGQTARRDCCSGRRLDWDDSLPQ